MSTSCPRRQRPRFLLTIALALSLAAGGWPGPRPAAGTQAPEKAAATGEAPAETNAETEERAREAYGKLGVSFEENRGQVDERVRFLSRGGGASLYLADDGATFVLSEPDARDSAADERPVKEKGLPEARARREGPKSHAVHMKFESANPWAEVSGERELEGKVNYFRGSDPSKWQTNVRTYGAVRYRGIYEGVDLVYYGNDRGEMEYDFVVAPGADPRQISLKVEGARALKVDAAGDLVIETPAGPLRQRRPTVYQEVEGERRVIDGSYALGARGRVRFALGEYDTSAPLIIDPVVDYDTRISASSRQYGYAVAADSGGNAYVTGYIRSINFGPDDTFVAKLNADGSALVYFTYLGGSGDESGYGIAVDPAGNAYVTGRTTSADFPTANAIQSVKGAGPDAFVLELNADGSALVYSTYLGDDFNEYGAGIAVNAAGNAYVAGGTYSLGFPYASSAPAANNDLNVFVVKFSVGGGGLVYSTTFGGEGVDACGDIAVDSAGNVYVAGETYSTKFPTANALQGAMAGGSDAFVTKLNAAGSEFVYSTYLGGSGHEGARGIAVDAAGNAYVTGETYSTDFPVVNPIQGASPGGSVFVTKLDAAGSALVYSTYLGGGSSDLSQDIAVDSSGNAYVTGDTRSADFPVVHGRAEFNSLYGDSFFAELDAAGSSLLYSGYIGGPHWHGANGVAVDSADNAYVTGHTFRDVHPRGIDAFVIKYAVSPFIRGRVVTRRAGGLVGVPWVTVKLTGTQTMTKLTDAHGYYSFAGLVPGGDHAVTVSKANLSFAPARRTYADLYSGASGVNFTVPSLSVSDVIMTERNAGEVTVTFHVSLSPISGEPVTVSYQTLSGAVNPAADGADYTAVPVTQLSFGPRQFRKALQVKVKGDTLDEENETFRLLLNSPTNALIYDDTGVCTIVDNDAAPLIAVSDATVTEADAGTVNATFTVTLSAASARTVTVGYAAGGGTAAAGTDYTAQTWRRLTFNPGETSKTVTVEVKGDTVKEPDETFFLKLSGAGRATIADAQGLCTITDDD